MFIAAQLKTYHSNCHHNWTVELLIAAQLVILIVTISWAEESC